jgi:hypothetical protein
MEAGANAFPQRVSAVTRRVCAIALMSLLGGAAAAPAAVSVRFDLSDPAGSPFPSDRFTVRDWSNLTLRRVNLLRPDCAVRPSDCEDLDVINTLDGFSTQPRITVPFTGAIDPASVTSRTVYLVNLGDTLSLHGFGKRVGINQVVWDPATLTLAFESDELLAQHSRYLLVVTDGVKDAAGRPIGPGAFGRLVERPTGVGPAVEFERELRDAARSHRVASQRVVAATLFTTQSITADLEKIARRIKQSRPAPIDFMIGRDTGGAPVRTVFPVATLTNVLFTRQTGTAPTFAAPVPAPLSLLNLVPGAVGQIAYGNFSSPDYLTANAILPPTGTLWGEPRVQRINRLLFLTYLPAGPRPAAGWPVAIFHHGGGASIHAGSQWRVASMLASHGIAMIAMHAVGAGGGPLGTLRVQRSDAPEVVLEAGGRGADFDGDGLISTSEGHRPPAPWLALGARDAPRQTAADAMQLVRQIELGIDIDGDGRPDLDASRISMLGQSGGTNNAAMALAIDPNVGLGVLNTAGGSGIEANRQSAGRFLVGMSLAARVPSLINVGGPSGLEFNENIPLRNLPPVTNTVPGAMAVASLLDRHEWVQQSGNGVAYAPYFRAQPLPGRAPKAVLVQVDKGDQSTPTPTAIALVRAGDLADRTTMYRHDLAFAANPALPKDGHTFLTFGIVVPGWTDIALAAQRQIAMFLASSGATTIDPDDAGPLFEVPIPLPLPETFDFIP